MAISLRHRTCILNGASLMFLHLRLHHEKAEFAFSLLLRRGRATECMLFYFYWAAEGMVVIAGGLSVKDDDRRTATCPEPPCGRRVTATDTSTPVSGGVTWVCNTGTSNPTADVTRHT